MQVGRLLAVVVALCMVETAAAAAVDRPVTVSPGGAETVEPAPTRCPTFSWGGVEKAHGYELVVYELNTSPGGTPLPGQRPSLSASLPGSARSWTPAADRCLADATAYAWFVRALGKQVGEWSTGAMFRTPTATPPAAMEEEVLRLVERYLAGISTPGSMADCGASAPMSRRQTPPASSASALPATGRADIGKPDPTDDFALRVEEGTAPGNTAVAIYGISNSDANGSTGVAGYASGATAEVSGVAGFSQSPDGRGVYGLSEATAGGVGVMGRDEAGSGLSAGVVGLTANPDGYAGFFWNEATGENRIALVVAEPIGDPPTSVGIEFSVDTRGNLFADGSASVGEVTTSSFRLIPLSAPSACTLPDHEGQVYYDDTEDWLCICSNNTWKRADDGTTCNP